MSYIRWEDKSRLTPVGSLENAAPPRSMWEVIEGGGAARQASLEVKPQHKSCPWCGMSPYPVTKVHNRYIVACENPECKIDAQAAGATPEEALAIWDARI